MKTALGRISCLVIGAIACAWVMAGTGQPLAQEKATRELLPNEAACRDSLRALLEQAQRLAVRIASQDTMPFGHDILARPTNGFGPSAIGAVDPGYPIGPGDEIIVHVWGEVELGYTLTVDGEGGIIIPKVGRLQVGGIPLGELKGTIARFLSRAYSSIHEDPAEARALVSVSLGKLRSIEVFVVGEVRSPGAYILSGSATVLHALYRAAGPAPNGSLRGIRLVRHDRVVGAVDLYRFILDGDKSEDVRL
ncbi:MAG: polysaccharide biosynthesis/export family protein, partial [Candidatus Latescibacteria bacterium]|nr:polysaccharide biosynthesis/export family protein [Candidatus Latescibacterota bacterium]